MARLVPSSLGIPANIPTDPLQVIQAFSGLIGAVNQWIGLAAPILNGFGTATNDNAAPGQVGEYLSTIVLIGSKVVLTSGMSANIATRALTAGDWDVSAELWLDTNAATTISIVKGGITTTTGTIPTIPADGIGLAVAYPGSLAGETPILPIGLTRVSLAATKNVFLVANVTFAVNACAGYGKLRARRVR